MSKSKKVQSEYFLHTDGEYDFTYHPCTDANYTPVVEIGLKKRNTKGSNPKMDIGLLPYRAIQMITSVMRTAVASFYPSETIDVITMDMLKAGDVTAFVKELLAGDPIKYIVSNTISVPMVGTPMPLVFTIIPNLNATFNISMMWSVTTPAQTDHINMLAPDIRICTCALEPMTGEALILLVRALEEMIGSNASDNSDNAEENPEKVQWVEVTSPEEVVDSAASSVEVPSLFPHTAQNADHAVSSVNAVEDSSSAAGENFEQTIITPPPAKSKTLLDQYMGSMGGE